MAGVIFSAIFTGLVTGMLARFALPGPDPMPIWLTTAIGLAGTLIGGAIAVAIVGRDPSWVAIGGFLAAIVLVGLYRKFVQKRALWGPDAYKFPERGVGVPEYRERLERAGIDPDAITNPFAAAAQQQQQQQPAQLQGPVDVEDPTENPAHFLGLLEELHDTGVLTDEEYDGARTRLLERLRA
jgi:uncharacterized membrane protein YeaQ/YmgE (transglycosylase-associated protein family)